MKKLLALLVVVLIACNDNLTATGEQLKTSITTYLEDSAQLGQKLVIDSLVVLQVDTLSKKDFFEKVSDQYKIDDYWYKKYADDAAYEVSHCSDMMRILRDDPAAVSNYGNKLQIAKLRQDTIQRRLTLVQKQLDSCNKAASAPNTNEPGGYLVKVFQNVIGKERAYKGETWYLVSKDMKAAQYISWDESQKKYNAAGNQAALSKILEYEKTTCIDDHNRVVFMYCY